MHYPYLESVSKPRNVQMNFGGLNKKESCGESEFSKQTGISSSEYPLMIADNTYYEYTPSSLDTALPGSAKRGTDIVHWTCRLFGSVSSPEIKVYVYVGMTSHIVSGYFASATETELANWSILNVIIGNLLICQYSGSDANKMAYIDLSDYSSGLFGEKVTANSTALSGATVDPCLPGGGTITTHDEAYYTTHTPTDGDYKAADSGGLYQWNSSYATWVAIANTDVRIQTQGALGTNDFSVGDGVRVTLDGVDWSAWAEGKNIFVNQGSGSIRYIDTVIKLVSEDEIQFAGQISKRFSIPSGATLTIERRVPEFSYVTECNNRLWGCSTDGHEIYCSKLGDIKNFYCFEGISTDSWASTVGSDGVFSAAATYNNSVYFFKRDSIIKVLPSNSGAHVVVENRNRGAVSNTTIQIINSVMYYEAFDCICAFEGTTPVSISDKLGSMRNITDGNGFSAPYTLSCGVRDKYYLLIGSLLYAYDTKNGIWTLEKNVFNGTRGVRLNSLIEYDSELLGMGAVVEDTGGGNFIASRYLTYLKVTDASVLFSSGWIKRDNRFSARTGLIGYYTPDHKYVSKIQLYCKPYSSGCEMSVFIVYEDSGERVRVGTIRPSLHGDRSFNFTIIPRRCTHFQIELEGKGKIILYSITKSLEEGSDVV